MTLLEHSDHILAAKVGEVLLVVDSVIGVDMMNGGSVRYVFGDRLRVKGRTCSILWCLDDNARTVTFDRSDMSSLERK